MVITLLARLNDYNFFMLFDGNQNAITDRFSNPLVFENEKAVIKFFQNKVKRAVKTGATGRVYKVIFPGREVEIK